MISVCHITISHSTMFRMPCSSMVTSMSVYLCDILSALLSYYTHSTPYTRMHIERASAHNTGGRKGSEALGSALHFNDLLSMRQRVSGHAYTLRSGYGNGADMVRLKNGTCSPDTHSIRRQGGVCVWVERAWNMYASGVHVCSRHLG